MILNPVGAKAAFAAAVTILASHSIITRHDVSDDEYIALAREARALVHLNLPDGEGVLVSPSWVLTAAHVAVELAAGDSVSVVGEGSFAIVRTVVHPAWDDGPNDIALVQLSGTARTPPVKPYRYRDEVGQLVLVAGAGDSGTGISGPRDNDGEVRAASNRVDSASDLWLRWDFSGPDDPGTTEFEGISGPGDSGGPAYVTRGDTVFVAGVSSGQSTRATGGIEGVYGVTEFYTRVSSYLPWIEETMNRGSAPGERPNKELLLSR